MAPATEGTEPKPPLEQPQTAQQDMVTRPNRQSIQASLRPDPTEEEELASQARRTPYTAWTMDTDVAILGPNGGTIHSIPKRGTRVEVLRVVPQYAQIMCSGCAPPKQNQAGWIDIEEINMEWDMPEGDPLLSMLVLREKWLKNDGTPEELLTDRRAICMLFDNGYVEEEKGLVWSLQGGEIVLTAKENEWIVYSVIAPSEPPAPSWRCDHPTKPRQK